MSNTFPEPPAPPEPEPESEPEPDPLGEPPDLPPIKPGNFRVITFATRPGQVWLQFGPKRVEDSVYGLRAEDAYRVGDAIIKAARRALQLTDMVTSAVDERMDSILAGASLQDNDEGEEEEEGGR
jgi:hypothetical protein